MKTFSFIFLLFFLASDTTTDESHSGNYLQIKTENTNISYPPQTAFELYNSNNELLYTQEDLPEIYEISSSHRLVLHPSWRKGEEVYRLEKATLLMRNHDSELWIHSGDQTNEAHSTSVKATKQLSNSTKSNGNYNLTLTFTNGLIFNYTDGKSEAILNGQAITIAGKYVIDSDLGTYKISFNPENGETWWVFEPKNQ